MQPKNTKQFTRWHEMLLEALMRGITSVNIWLLTKSKGRLGNSFLGMQVLLLTTIGRKSGKPRTIPLYYIEKGNQVVLVASRGGTANNPAWYLNILANPDVTINIRREEREMIAHPATSEEKAHLWPQLTAAFPKWQMMEDRSKRSFPVIILDPSET